MELYRFLKFLQSSTASTRWKLLLVCIENTSVRINCGQDNMQLSTNGNLNLLRNDLHLKRVGLIQELYTETRRNVRVEVDLSDWFEIKNWRGIYDAC